MTLNERINNILAELNITATTEDEKQEMVDQLTEHFNKIIIETLLLNLSDEQVEKFKGYMEKDSDEELDEHVMQMAAEVPGLQFKIDEAIQTEFESLKAAKQVLDKG